LILSFRHKGLARLYNGAERKGLPTALVSKCERILARLDVATGPEMMNLPGLRLHPLRGQLKGFWSVWLSGNWRIIFRFKGNDVIDVDLVDYH
jgi:proteic killer suppression protein